MSVPIIDDIAMFERDEQFRVFFESISNEQVVVGSIDEVCVTIVDNDSKYTNLIFSFVMFDSYLFHCENYLIQIKTRPLALLTTHFVSNHSSLILGTKFQLSVNTMPCCHVMKLK